MTSGKIFVVAAAILGLFSACKDIDLAEPGIGCHYVYFPRECKYVYVQNFNLDTFVKDTVGQNWMLRGFRFYITRAEKFEVSSCQADSLCLGVTTTSFTPEEFTENGNDIFKFLSDHDDNIEKNINKTIKEHGSTLYMVEYRKETCKSLTITSSDKLFGRNAGEDLSDKFIFLATPECCDFLVDSDKNLIGTIKSGMTISEYLSYNPIIFPAAYFRLMEIPPEAPIETTLTVRVGLGNGKSFNDSSSIKLLD